MAKTALILATGLTLAAATSAAANGPCLPRDAVVDRLDSVYSEKLLAGGLRGDNAVIEVFMSADGESWTLVQSFANGVSCIMAAGTHWQQNDPLVLFSVDG